MKSKQDRKVDYLKAMSAFRSMGDKLDENFKNGLKQILNFGELSEQLGKYLHDLRRNKPDEGILQEIISIVPESLSYKNEKGRLPIHTAARYTSCARYVPFLAREGIKHKVGGGNKRGGLLIKAVGSDFGTNALQLLSNLSSSDDTKATDSTYLDVIKELRDTHLLLQEDIQEYNLLMYSCCSSSRIRFEYFAAWLGPGALMRQWYKEMPIAHAFVYCHPNPDRLAVFLGTTLRTCGPAGDTLGGLFLQDQDGRTACEKAFQKYGVDGTMKMLGTLIPFEDPQFPIIHFVARYAPQFMNEFVSRYTSAIYLRDPMGNTVQQVIMASGSKTFRKHAMFFVGMRDEQIREMDPVTHLYPFMVIASLGQDLDAIYYILRRDPSLAYK